MNAEQFIEVLKIQTSDAAVRSLATNLPSDYSGKNLHAARMSESFKKLPKDARTLVLEIAKEAAELAVFNFLAVIDGEKVMEYTESKGEFELYFVKDGVRVLLNSDASPALHHLYVSETKIAALEDTEPPADPIRDTPS